MRDSHAAARALFACSHITVTHITARHGQDMGAKFDSRYRKGTKKYKTGVPHNSGCEKLKTGIAEY